MHEPRGKNWRRKFEFGDWRVYKKHFSPGAFYESVRLRIVCLGLRARSVACLG
jgi:hypothetical protein